MKKVIIASDNPVKIKSVSEGFSKMFPQEEFDFESVPVSSGVPDQPIGNEETLTGAKNRVEAIIKKKPKADFYVGIEGGIVPLIKDREQDSLDVDCDDMQTSAWVVISSEKRVGKARTAGFFLPKQIRELVKEGKELGTAADILFNGQDIKRQNGTIGILTDNLVDRTSHYVSAVILALISFKHPELY